MARLNGGFTESLLAVAQRSFISGCFGCLGAGSITLVAFVLVFVVFPAQFVAIVRTVSIPFVPALTTRAVVPTVCTAATIQTNVVEVFVTVEEQPAAVRVSQVKLKSPQPLFVCVRSVKAEVVRFAIRITMPDGQAIPFGNELATDAASAAFCLGPLPDLSVLEGPVRIEAVSGTTVVGSTVLTVVP